MPIAEEIPSRVEFYHYTGQPRDEWPDWLRSAFADLAESRKGKIAVATYDTDDGEPVWWRWFEEQKFYERFRQIA